MTGMFDRKWKGRASVPKLWKFFKRIQILFANFDYWLKRRTLWYVISLKWCRKMAVHKCYTLKTEKPFYRPPLFPAVRCWPWEVFSSWLASRDLGTARSSFLARVGSVPTSIHSCLVKVNNWIRIALLEINFKTLICRQIYPTTYTYAYIYINIRAYAYCNSFTYRYICVCVVLIIE